MTFEELCNALNKAIYRDTDAIYIGKEEKIMKKAKFKIGDMVRILDGSKIKLGEHEKFRDMLAFIEGDNGYYLIGLDGIKKVKKSETE